MNKFLKFLSGLVAILTLLAIIYYVVVLFLGANVNVKLGVLTATVSLFTIIYNNNKQQNREISSRHFTEKTTSYQRFIDTLFDFLHEEKIGKSPDASPQKMQEIMKGFMVWASADTINIYNEFMRHSVSEEAGGSDSKGVPLNFSHIERLLRSMRKDLGHADDGLERFGLSKLIIKADEHDKLN